VHRTILILCASLLLSWGCIPQFIISDDATITPVGVMSDEPNVTPEVYAGKAYLIGTVYGPLADELKASISFTPYGGTETDGPIFIAGNVVDNLTDAQKAGLIAALNARMPIVLVHAAVDTVNLLIDLLYGEYEDYTLPAGVDYVELFAADIEPNGELYQWTMYPPADSDTKVDGTGDRQGRVNILVGWLRENEARMNDETGATAKAALKLAAAEASQQLTDLASAFVRQDNFTDCDGRNYQVSHYIYSCHSMTTNEDWIYVKQQSILNTSIGYSRVNVTDLGGGMVIRQRLGPYLSDVLFDNTLQGYANNPTAVGLQLSSPETANNVAQLTSGVSWNIGGQIAFGVQGEDPTASATVSGGVTISNQTTVNVQDCETLNTSNSKGNNAAWHYQFKKPDAIGYFGAVGIAEAPSLARTTFQPVNQWIWRMAPTVRASKPSLSVSFSVILGQTDAVWDFFWVARAERREYPATWDYSVPFNFPPVR